MEIRLATVDDAQAIYDILFCSMELGIGTC